MPINKNNPIAVIAMGSFYLYKVVNGAFLAFNQHTAKIFCFIIPVFLPAGCNAVTEDDALFIFDFVDADELVSVLA